MIPDARERPWLTTHEVAELTGESVDAWWRMARTGEAPIAPIRLGRLLRWPTAPLLRVLGLEPSPDATTAAPLEGATDVLTDQAIPRRDLRSG